MQGVSLFRPAARGVIVCRSAIFRSLREMRLRQQSAAAEGCRPALVVCSKSAWKKVLRPAQRCEYYARIASSRAAGPAKAAPDRPQVSTPITCRAFLARLCLRTRRRRRPRKAGHRLSARGTGFSTEARACATRFRSRWRRQNFGNSRITRGEENVVTELRPAEAVSPSWFTWPASPMWTGDPRAVEHPATLHPGDGWKTYPRSQVRAAS